jgi:hypothetical protein
VERREWKGMGPLERLRPTYASLAAEGTSPQGTEPKCINACSNKAHSIITGAIYSRHMYRTSLDFLYTSIQSSLPVVAQYQNAILTVVVGSGMRPTSYMQGFRPHLIILFIPHSTQLTGESYSKARPLDCTVHFHLVTTCVCASFICAHTC